MLVSIVSAGKIDVVVKYEVLVAMICAGTIDVVKCSVSIRSEAQAGYLYTPRS